MRIGMILDTSFPDDARVSNECDELIKRGHEIFLFCLSYKQKFLKKLTRKLEKSQVELLVQV